MSFPLLTFAELVCCVQKLTGRVTTLETINRVEAASTSALANATLVGGTIAIADTNVTAGALVQITRKTIGGTAGNLSYTVTAGVGITINSSSGTDTSVVTYQITY